MAKRQDSIRIDATSDAILLNRWVALVTETKYRPAPKREDNVPLWTKQRYQFQWKNIWSDIKSLARLDFRGGLGVKLAYSLAAFFFILQGKHLESYLTAFVIGSVSYDSAAQTSHSGEPATISWNITIGSNSDRCVIVSVNGLSGLNDPTFDSLATVDILSVGALKSNYYLNPGTGSKTCAAGGGNIKVGGAISLYGVDQQAPIGSVTTENGSSSPNDMTLVTQENNSMRIDVLGSNRDDSNSPTGSLDSGDLRHNAITPQNQFRIGLFGYTNFQATAGSDTHAWTTSGFNRYYGAFEVKALLDTPVLIGTNDSDFSTSKSHTVPSGTDVLAIVVANRQGTISNVQWNGANATKLVGAATAFNESVELWYINNPTPATGNITASFSGGDGRVLGGYNLDNVDTAGTYDFNSATGSSSNPNVTLTTTETGVFVLDAGISEGDYVQPDTPEVIQLENLQSASYQNVAVGYGEKGATGTRRVGWGLTSSQRWAHVVGSFPVATGGGGETSNVKKLSGVLHASIKKISSIAEASVKKVSGVNNV